MICPTHTQRNTLKQKLASHYNIHLLFLSTCCRYDIIIIIIIFTVSFPLNLIVKRHIHTVQQQQQHHLLILIFKLEPTFSFSPTDLLAPLLTSIAPRDGDGDGSSSCGVLSERREDRDKRGTEDRTAEEKTPKENKGENNEDDRK